MFMIFQKTTWRTSRCGHAVYYSGYRGVHLASGLGATYRAGEGVVVKGTALARGNSILL